MGKWEICRIYLVLLNIIDLQLNFFSINMDYLFMIYGFSELNLSFIEVNNNKI